MIILKSLLLEDYLDGYSSNTNHIVVRETVANAVDANIETGVYMHDIKVSTDKDTYIVKDKGNGISPETIELIFTNQFFSTRNDIAKYVGRHGFGLKAILLHTPEYLLITNYENREYTYQVNLINMQRRHF